MLIKRAILIALGVVLLAGCGVDCSYPNGLYNPQCRGGAAGFQQQPWVGPQQAWLGPQQQPWVGQQPQPGFPVAGGYYGAPCSPTNPYCFH